MISSSPKTSLPLITLLALLASSAAGSPLASRGIGNETKRGDDEDPNKVVWPKVRLYSGCLAWDGKDYLRSHNTDDPADGADGVGWDGADNSNWWFDFNETHTAETFHAGYFDPKTAQKVGLPTSITKEEDQRQWHQTHGNDPWTTGTPTLKIECTLSATSTTLGTPEPAKTTFAQTTVVGENRYPNAGDKSVHLLYESLPTGTSTLADGPVNLHCSTVKNEPFPKLTASAAKSK
ncbi:hypothetical protein IAT40_002218 [Kwoniella sp. CBS 6097]